MRAQHALPFTLAAFAASACATRERAPDRAPPGPTAVAAELAAPAGASPTGREPSTIAAAIATPRPQPTIATLTARPLALPDATPPTPAALDYIVYEKAVREQARDRVWIPVGNSGTVDVLDVTDGTFARVSGFQTQQRDFHGKTRVMGPSAATIGEGVAYIGNRATNEVCVVDAKMLKLGMCLKLTSPTDGVAYVASTREVWVTTPRDDTLTVLDASKPKTLRAKTVIKLEGAPEGYAVDDTRGLFFTNLEDKNRTVVLDVKTHEVAATWNPECGADGPRGIASDASSGLIFVACTDRVQILDGLHGGVPLGHIDAGAGVDNIDWLDAHRLLYVAAGKAATLTVARVDDRGRATVVAQGVTAEGARNGVADAKGNAYVADPLHGRVLVFAFSP